MQTNTKKKKGEIIAKAITSRNFDIPSYMYDLIDNHTVEAVFNQYDKDACLKLFLTNHDFQEFCMYVTDFVNLRKEFFMEVIRTHGIWKGLFIFSESHWAQLESCCFSVKLHGDVIEEVNGAPGIDEEFPVTDDEIMNIVYMAIVNPELIHQFEYVYRFALISFKEFIAEFKEKVPVRYLVNAVTQLGVSDNYVKSSVCIEEGIPVLYQHYDCSDLYIYLQSVIETSYTGTLDPILDDINTFIHANNEFLTTDEILDMLWFIGTKLNQNNLKYYYIAADKVETDVTKLMMILSKKNTNIMPSWGCLKDFKDLIIILGHKPAGYSIDLQKLFLENGGDIKTMFDENNRLLTEASIIQTTDMLPFLFQVMSDDDLLSLIYTSSEFVTNLMTSTWVNRDHLLRVLQVMFTMPVDEDLWRVINNPSLDAEFTDYRASIINKAVTSLSKEAVIIAVPKAVAYIEPTILFVSKNMTEEYIRFFPVTKIAPMLKNIIGRYGYLRFNLFCNGTNVSIAKAVGDTQFIIDTLILDKKYGYLCDMEGENVERIIDVIVEHME